MAIAVSVLCASGCGVLARKAVTAVTAIKTSQVFVQGRRGPLTSEEQHWAEYAWHFVGNNYGNATGLVAGSDRGSLATAWDMGDTVAMTLIAHDLQLLDNAAFDERISTFIAFLNTAELVDGHLPNLYYDVHTGKPMRGESHPGIAGWSVRDCAHLLLWLYVLRERYAHFRGYINSAVRRWSLCAAVEPDGVLHNAQWLGGHLTYSRSERIGYEDYDSLGFSLWGLAVSRDSPSSTVRAASVLIRKDDRDPRTSTIPDSVLSGPYLLAGIEFGWDLPFARRPFRAKHTDTAMAEQAGNIYQAQAERYRQTQTITARTDHRSAVFPDLIHDSIFASGYSWNTVTTSGQFAPETSLVATKAAFGIWALWKTDYSDTVLADVEELRDPQRGWFEGRMERTGGYDRTITLATNAMVMEALQYKRVGRLVPELTHDGASAGPGCCGCANPVSADSR